MKKHFDPVNLAESSCKRVILLLTLTMESSVEELLATAAVQECVPLHLLSAVSEEECLVKTVEKLVNNKCWILIEHIRLMRKWQDKVESICQVSKCSLFISIVFPQ